MRRGWVVTGCLLVACGGSQPPAGQPPRRNAGRLMLELGLRRGLITTSWGCFDRGSDPLDP